MAHLKMARWSCRNNHCNSPRICTKTWQICSTMCNSQSVRFLTVKSHLALPKSTQPLKWLNPSKISCTSAICFNNGQTRYIHVLKKVWTPTIDLPWSKASLAQHRSTPTKKWCSRGSNTPTASTVLFQGSRRDSVQIKVMGIEVEEPEVVQALREHLLVVLRKVRNLLEAWEPEKVLKAQWYEPIEIYNQEWDLCLTIYNY